MILLFVILSITGDSLVPPLVALAQINILWRNDFYYHAEKENSALPLLAGGSGCLMWEASIVDAGIEATKRNKSGWLAALLSLLIPGAGQFYNGQYLKAATGCCISYGGIIVAMARGFGYPPHSSRYFPIQAEKDFFDKAKNHIYPKEVKDSIFEFSDTLLCWFGIVKSVDFHTINDSFMPTFLIEQKFYDYILDYSIQTEKIFLSPMGEGDFIYRTRSFVPYDTVMMKQEILKIATPGNLAICYGYPDTLTLNGEPVLKNGCIIFADDIWYSTGIFSYTMRRNESGEPVMENFKVLRTP